MMNNGLTTTTPCGKWEAAMLRNGEGVTVHFHQTRGLVLPVSVLMEVSGYPDAATAMQAFQDSKQALEVAKARKAALEVERAVRFPNSSDWHKRDRWEIKNDYEEAGWELKSCRDHLEHVEQRMGIFHPDARSRLEGFVTSAVELLDQVDGDAEAEDNNDREATDGDDTDSAWIEWHTMRGSQKRGAMNTGHCSARGMPLHEDDEDSDPAEEDDHAEEDDPSGQCDEDGINTASAILLGPEALGPGCPHSDPGGCQYS